MKKVLFTFMFFFLLMFICYVPEVFAEVDSNGEYSVVVKQEEIKTNGNINILQNLVGYTSGDKKDSESTEIDVIIYDSVFDINKEIIIEFKYWKAFRKEDIYAGCWLNSLDYEKKESYAGVNIDKQVVTDQKNESLQTMIFKFKLDPTTTYGGWYKFVTQVRSNQLIGSEGININIVLNIGDIGIYQNDGAILANSYLMKPFYDSTVDKISSYIKSYAQKAYELGDMTLENSYYKRIVSELERVPQNVYDEWVKKLDPAQLYELRNLYIDVYNYLKVSRDYKNYTDLEKFTYFLRCQDEKFEIATDITLGETLLETLNKKYKGYLSTGPRIIVSLITGNGEKEQVLSYNKSFEGEEIGVISEFVEKGSTAYVYFRFRHQDFDPDDPKTFTINGRTYGQNSGGEKGKDWDYEDKTTYGYFSGLAKITVSNQVTLKINCGQLGFGDDKEVTYKYTIYFRYDQSGNNWGNFDDALTNTDKYTPNSSNSSGVSKAEEKIGKILGVITNIGIIVSAIMVAVLGVKYMIGSVEEKAEYKHDMIPYLVGNILLFGICTIVKILQAVGQSFN